MEDAAPAPDVTEITYADFGERFFVHAVSEERILHGFRGLAGNEIAFGPIGAGPGRFAKVSAKGEMGSASAERQEGLPVTFRLTIPVALELVVDLGVDKHRFDGDVAVGLDLVARAADELRVVIDIPPPTASDVTVSMRSDAVRSEIFRRVTAVESEIARFVAKYVAREIDKPHIREARHIDVAARIDGAYGPSASG
jgi:hypothetical protein